MAGLGPTIHGTFRVAGLDAPLTPAEAGVQIRMDIWVPASPGTAEDTTDERNARRDT